MNSAEDLANRCGDIHWPDRFDPERSDAFTHNEVHIDAPAVEVWRHLIRAEAWPHWYSNAKNVKVVAPDGVLADAVDFRWTTFGAEVDSSVRDFVPEMRISWMSRLAGAELYHTWLFTPHGKNSTHVIAEEVAIGELIRGLAQANPGHMHRGHELWNVSLKFLCES